MLSQCSAVSDYASLWCFVLGIRSRGCQMLLVPPRPSSWCSAEQPFIYSCNDYVLPLNVSGQHKFLLPDWLMSGFVFANNYNHDAQKLCEQSKRRIPMIWCLTLSKWVTRKLVSKLHMILSVRNVCLQNRLWAWVKSYKVHYCMHILWAWVKSYEVHYCIHSVCIPIITTDFLFPLNVA